MADHRVALIGYGLAGSAFHAPLIDAADGLRLALIVTGSAERAGAARGRYPGAEVVGSVPDLWARSGDFDCVVVASPNDTHVPFAEEAIRRGKAVVVDKPVAATSAQARRLAGLATGAGVALTVFQNRRWDGDFLTAARLIAEGSLGEVVRLESRFDRWRPVVDRDRWRESAEPQRAGGLLFDLGSHLVDQALVLLGPVASVYAEVRRRRPGAAVDDDIFVALAHASGAVSHLSATMLAAQPGPRLRVLGTKAAYVVAGLDPQEDQLRAGAVPGSPGFGAARPQAWGRLGAASPVPEPTLDGRYLEFYRMLSLALSGDGPVPVDPMDAVAALEVIEAARTSSDRGEVVRLGPPR